MDAHQDEPLIVAIDDGYAQTKLWGERSDGLTETFMMRSSARPGRYALMSLSGDGTGGSYRTEEGEEFTVSEDIEGENTQFDGFHTSPMNRVLVHHALRQAGYGGERVHLVSALPVGDFFRNGRRDEGAIEAKRANLMKRVFSSAAAPAALSGTMTTGTGTAGTGAGGTGTGAAGGLERVDAEMAQVTKVDVGCQALAAFVDYWLDDDLNERDVPVDKVAVVDVGGRTTDIVLVLDGKSFDPRRSGTENIGVLDVYVALADMIRGHFRTRDAYPMALLDRAVRLNRIRLWGRDHDITELVESAVREQQTKITREIERRLGTASDVDTVLFVGGGSALFRGIAALFPNGHAADSPEWANARGLLKYTKYFAAMK